MCTPSNTCFLGSTQVHARTKQYLDRLSRFSMAYNPDRLTDKQTTLLGL